MPEQKPVVILLAGDYQQFREHAALSPNVKYIDGTNPRHLFGVEANAVFICGTFWDRKDAHKIFSVARTRVR